MSEPLNSIYATLASFPWYGWIAVFTLGCAAIVALAMRKSPRA